MKNTLNKIDFATMRALEWATTTKGAFWALFVLIIVANSINPPKDLQAWLLVLVSEFYQGVALPGLGSQQKAEAEETRKLLQETHDVVMQELTAMKEMHDSNIQEMAEIKEILSILQTQNGGK